MTRPFLLSIAILLTLFGACEALYVQRHRPAVDPYACFGAGRYDAMRDGRVCKGFE